MGAWASDPFGNDTAHDWAIELRSCRTLAKIEKTIAKVLASPLGNIDSDAADEGVAAADVIARLKGKSYAKVEAVDGWVKKHRATALPEELVSDAVRAVDRIAEDQGLLECWDDPKEFLDNLKALKERLTGQGAGVAPASSKQSFVPLGSDILSC